MIGSLCSDLCFQLCALVFKAVVLFCAVCSLVCGVFLCSRICASSFAIWAAKLLAFRSFYFSVVLPVVFFRPSCSAFLCFHFFLFWIPEGGGEGGSEREHRRRQKERGRGKGLERGREQTREIGEIGRGRETERGEGQGRDKQGRERERW